MTARLEAAAPLDPNLVGLAAIDTTGRLWATSLTDKSSIGADELDQVQIGDVLTEGRPVVGAPRRGSTSGVPIVPIGVPVHGQDGQVIGVLQGTLSLTRLSARIRDVIIGESGYASLIAGDGTILTHPDPSRVLTVATGANEAVQLALQGQEVAMETPTANGQRVFAAAAPVGGVGGAGADPV